MKRNRRGWLFAVAVAALVETFGTAAPAHAHTRVFIGGAFGFPGYPAYPYSYYPYAYPVYPYPYSDAVPPPGWDPGHWERRQNRWGRWVEVWVPSHLR